MTGYVYKTVGVSVRLSAEELDRPRIIRGPWWREVLVKAGLLRPIYGRTLREQIESANLHRDVMEAQMRAAAGQVLWDKQK